MQTRAMTIARQLEFLVRTVHLVIVEAEDVLHVAIADNGDVGPQLRRVGLAHRPRVHHR